MKLKGIFHVKIIACIRVLIKVDKRAHMIFGDKTHIHMFIGNFRKVCLELIHTDTLLICTSARTHTFIYTHNLYYYMSLLYLKSPH